MFWWTMTPNLGYPEHVLNNTTSKVLFEIPKWGIVDFTKPGEGSFIWIAHQCDKALVKQFSYYPDYKWAHTIGIQSVKCCRCQEQIPEAVKTIYMLVASA